MNEAILKSRLMEHLRDVLPSDYVCFRHEDKMTNGIPDISITGNRITVWIEVKYANPKFKSKGIQELTMLRLAHVGHAFYIVFEDSASGDRKTHILTPAEMNQWPHCDSTPGIGFNYPFIANSIARICGIRIRS